MFRVLDLLPGREGGQVLKSQIHPHRRCPARERGRYFLDFRAKAHEIPSCGIEGKGHQIRSIDAGQRFGKLENPEFRQSQNATLPCRPSVLKAQAPRAAFAFELRMLGTAGEVVAKSGILIAKTLDEAGRGY